jgi:hypothetical protein
MLARALPRPRRKLRPVVGNDGLRVALSREDLFYNSDRLRRRRRGGGERFDPPGEEVGYDKNVPESCWCLWVRAYHVAGDDCERSLRLSRFRGHRCLRDPLLDLAHSKQWRTYSLVSGESRGQW